MITNSHIGDCRIGNQLFQYSVLRSVGIANNFEVSLPPLDQHRLSEFNIPNQILRKSGWNKMKYLFNEPSFSFDNTVFQVKDNTDLNGYFQSEKYFLNIENTIREEISFKPKVISKVKTKLYSIDSDAEICSIHVRRGDYLNEPDKHLNLTLDFYKRAIDKFPKNYKFIVFSDDIPWCKNNFHGENISFSDDNTDIEDLAMMSLCRHNIIANSTFSWWGAWLNENPEKIVISPKKWFGTTYAKYSTIDLLPKPWVQL